MAKSYVSRYCSDVVFQIIFQFFPDNHPVGNTYKQLSVHPPPLKMLSDIRGRFYFLRRIGGRAPIVLLGDT